MLSIVEYENKLDLSNVESAKKSKEVLNHIETDNKSTKSEKKN
jgi:hypothetical protein